MDGIDLLRRYYAAYNAGDEDGLRACLADGVVLVPGEGLDQQIGVERYLAVYRQSRALFEDVMVPADITQHGDAVSVVLRNHLTARADVADYFGMAVARGATLTLNLDARYRVADGRIMAISLLHGA